MALAKEKMKTARPAVFDEVEKLDFQHLNSAHHTRILVLIFTVTNGPWVLLLGLHGGGSLDKFLGPNIGSGERRSESG